MARRARKRRSNAPPSRPPRPGARDPAGQGATNGRARHHDDEIVATGDRAGRDDDVLASGGGEAMARGYARSRERDEAARAALVPLGPGERPWPIVVCAVLAAGFAVANVVLLIAGWEVDGDRPVAGGLAFAGIMLATAVGMWFLKYWAVLGFEVLLGVTFAGAMLSILRASNLEAVLLSVGVMALTGPLFWLLIRQMARIQMPKRPKR